MITFVVFYFGVVGGVGGVVGVVGGVVGVVGGVIGVVLEHPAKRIKASATTMVKNF